MRARLPLLAFALLLPACGMERSPSLMAPPVGAQTVRLCAAVDGKLRDFTGWIDPATGDTMVSGRRFRDVFPAEYAGTQGWFAKQAPLPFSHLQRYRPYGLPRSLSPEDLRSPGAELAHRVDGIEMFATLPRHAERERAQKTREMYQEEILYLPVHAGCVFQPYQDPRDYGFVRDDTTGTR